jgi:antitoxin VapB
VYHVTVALNIKNQEVEHLVAEVARLAGETKTEAVRQALIERRHRLTHRLGPLGRRDRALRFLEHEVWPIVPDAERGRRLTRAEEDAILGYGAEGA